MPKMTFSVARAEAHRGCGKVCEEGDASKGGRTEFDQRQPAALGSRRGDGRHAKICASCSHGQRGNPGLGRRLQQKRGAATAPATGPVSGVSAAATRIPRGPTAIPATAAAVSSAAARISCGAAALSSTAAVPGEPRSWLPRACGHAVPAIGGRFSMSDGRPVPLAPLQHAGRQVLLALSVERRLSARLSVCGAGVRALIAATMTVRPSPRSSMRHFARAFGSTPRH